MRDTVRQVVLPLWNAYYFLTLYAGAAGTTGSFRTDQEDVLDRYLLGELAELIDALPHRWMLTTFMGRASRCRDFSTR